jgi:hypothetical protein
LIKCILVLVDRLSLSLSLSLSLRHTCRGLKPATCVRSKIMPVPPPPPPFPYQLRYECTTEGRPTGLRGQPELIALLPINYTTILKVVILKVVEFERLLSTN